MSTKIPRVVIIGINYYPEDSAIGLYTTQKAEYLVENGYEVTVITGFPYYPQWKIRQDYYSKPYLYNETINGVKVLRSKQYVPSDPTFSKRILHLISFTFGNFINLFRISKPDIVISIIPFTTSVLLGWFLKIRYDSKLWVHIQDFEFDAASESSIISKKNRNNILLKFIFGVERYLINKADITSTISKAMLKKLEKKSKSLKPKYLLPNWVDVYKINPNTCIRHEFLKSNKFKILYSGNIGEKQDWNLFIKLAEKLKINAKIEIIIVGDGARKGWLLNELKDYPNIHFHQPVIYDDLSSLLCSADIHILFQKDNVVDTVMPSKILAMMASKKPSIITGNLSSEVATIIKESKGGFYLKSNDLESVISTINELIINKNKAYQLGENAREYVKEHFSSEKILIEYKELLDSIIHNSKHHQ